MHVCISSVTSSVPTNQWVRQYLTKIRFLTLSFILQIEDVAEAALLPFKLTGNALPLEIVLQTGKNYKK